MESCYFLNTLHNLPFAFWCGRHGSIPGLFKLTLVASCKRLSTVATHWRKSLNVTPSNGKELNDDFLLFLFIKTIVKIISMKTIKTNKTKFDF